MTEIIETAGMVAHHKRVETPWGRVRVSLVVMAEGRKVRLGMPTTLPAEFRKKIAEAGRWIVEQRGHSVEAVDDLEAAIREALGHDIRKVDL